MVLAAFLFVKRMSDITDLKPVFTEGSETEEGEVAVPAGVRVFDVSGPLFFGAAQKFQDVLTEINDRQHLIIIRLRHVPMVDGTGLHRIGHIVHQLERQRKQVVITDAAPSVEAELRAEPWFREELLAVNVQVALGRMAEARNP